MKKNFFFIFIISLFSYIFFYSLTADNRQLSYNSIKKLKKKISIFPNFFRNKRCLEEENKFIKSANNIKYSFFIAGHSYGSPWDDNPGISEKLYKTLLKEKNKFNFGIFAGDVTREGDDLSWRVFDTQVKELDYNIHIAPGNHDIGTSKDNLKRKNFLKKFKYLYKSFIFENDLFVLLDAYEDGWSIKGQQLNFLKKELEKYYLLVDNIFIISSPVIFLNKNFDIKVNSYDGMKDILNFWDEVFPLIEKYRSNYYIVSGDIGAIKGHQLFCKKIENIKFIATGIGSGIFDNYLIFKKIGKNIQATSILF